MEDYGQTHLSNVTVPVSTSVQAETFEETHAP